MRFYNGGVGYTELIELPIGEVCELIKEANNIAAAEHREFEKARK